MAYHHGDLRRSLLDALPAVIEAQGLDRFSLRELARQAGVTHGAPSHHFGDRRGLLTAFATEGAQRLADSVEAALEPVAEHAHADRLTAVGMGYLEFALESPTHFDVTFRPELLDLSNADLAAARAAAGATLDRVLAAAQQDGALAPEHFAAVRIGSWSMAHGYAAIAKDQFARMPKDMIREQALLAFRHFTQAMLSR